MTNTQCFVCYRGIPDGQGMYKVRLVACCDGTAYAHKDCYESKDAMKERDVLSNCPVCGRNVKAERRAKKVALVVGGCTLAYLLGRWLAPEISHPRELLSEGGIFFLAGATVGMFVGHYGLQYYGEWQDKRFDEQIAAIRAKVQAERRATAANDQDN